MKEITTRSMSAVLRDDGIIILQPPPGWKGPEDVSHAQENIKALRELIGDQVCGMLAFIPDAYVDAEATAYYKENRPGSVASALIAKTFLQKFLGNIFLRFKDHGANVRLFTDKEAAMTWLKTNIKKHKEIKLMEQA